VWASLCLAYIRYRRWLSICEDDLREEAPRFVPDHPTYGAHTFLKVVQPFLAYIGMIGSLVIIVFASADMWTTQASALKGVPPYIPLVVLLVSFLALKLAHGRLHKSWWVYLNPDVTILINELERLERSRPVPRGGRRDDSVVTNPMEVNHSAAATLGPQQPKAVFIQETAYPANLHLGDAEPGPNRLATTPSPHTQQQTWTNVWK
jgi:hypothetical protein